MVPKEDAEQILNSIWEVFGYNLEDRLAFENGDTSLWGICACCKFCSKEFYNTRRIHGTLDFDGAKESLKKNHKETGCGATLAFCVPSMRNRSRLELEGILNNNT